MVSFHTQRKDRVSRRKSEGLLVKQSRLASKRRSDGLSNTWEEFIVERRVCPVTNTWEEFIVEERVCPVTCWALLEPCSHLFQFLGSTNPLAYWRQSCRHRLFLDDRITVRARQESITSLFVMATIFSVQARQELMKIFFVIESIEPFLQTCFPKCWIYLPQSLENTPIP